MTVDGTPAASRSASFSDIRDRAPAMLRKAKSLVGAGERRRSVALVTSSGTGTPRKGRIEMDAVGRRNVVDFATMDASSVQQVILGLTHLRMDRADLVCMDGLDRFRNVTHLYLQHNRIAQVEGLAHLPNLRFLALSNNRIATLDGFDSCPSLRLLDLSHNEIDKLDAEYQLPPELRYILLSHNPCAGLPGYRLDLVSRVPGLAEIDEAKITRTEREMARTLMGNRGKGRPPEEDLELVDLDDEEEHDDDEEKEDKSASGDTAAAYDSTLQDIIHRSRLRQLELVTTVMGLSETVSPGNRRASQHAADLDVVRVLSATEEDPAEPGCGMLTRKNTACPENSPETGAALEAKANQKKLIIATILCFAFFIVELVAGLWAGSLAILSDSFHLLSDIAGFAISLAALYLSQQPATKRHSYGFYRAEIIGAILSTFLIWILTAFLVWEAIDRVRNPVPVDGPIMFVTAAVGVVVNIVLGLTLHGDHGHSHGGHSHGGHSHGGHSHGAEDKHDHNSQEEESDHDHDHNHDHDHSHGHSHDEENPLSGAVAKANKPKKKAMNINVHAAAIHVIGDLLSSIGVLIAATIIWIKPDMTIVDPICTFVFSVFVLGTTVQLMYNSLTVLMEATPEDIDPHAVATDLRSIAGVEDIHDLHIWNLTLGKASLSVHLHIQENWAATLLPLDLADYHKILAEAQEMLCETYGIHHATVQLEGRHMDDGLIDGEANGLLGTGTRTPSSKTGSSDRGGNESDSGSSDAGGMPNVTRKKLHCNPAMCRTD
ncbi:hypothetical protein HKX48_003740 [Thoreauomyces humboldtii]|nr:hypothetical protein HKX48_003740 [Thoreauomyces humboldtii]